MKKIIVILAGLLFWQGLNAEVIVMKSGKRYSGEVMFRNEEVIIVKDATGTRFQCPMKDVLSVGAEETEPTPMITQLANSDLAIPVKKVCLAIEAAGGAVTIPGEQWGGYMDAQFMIGSRRIRNKNILLGGSVGYEGFFFADKTYSFIPIRFVARVPITDKEHAPQVNFSVGYGIASTKQYKGGLHASMDICYRYQMNDKSALLLGLNVLFQQASLAGSEQIGDQTFTTDLAGKGFVGIGAKIGILF